MRREVAETGADRLRTGAGTDQRREAAEGHEILEVERLVGGLDEAESIPVPQLVRVDAERGGGFVEPVGAAARFEGVVSGQAQKGSLGEHADPRPALIELFRSAKGGAHAPVGQERPAQ